MGKLTQIYIPEIGTRIVLEKDWCFKLRPEQRNDTLYNGYTDKLPSKLNWKERQEALQDEDGWLVRTLPEKTELVRKKKWVWMVNYWGVYNKNNR